ncbi:hypothetical protein EVAR_2829_1 [Eumeta japonica]|uniref:Uncharacterized protein n=1 Tax=Eumeta variegata TaxID=151549 RepID=A0A4C1T0K5_EUMVA|nr:hypothetical protein EVAR_2829_1 [Eumeta japonica]
MTSSSIPLCRIRTTADSDLMTSGVKPNRSIIAIVHNSIGGLTQRRVSAAGRSPCVYAPSRNRVKDARKAGAAPPRRWRRPRPPIAVHSLLRLLCLGDVARTLYAMNPEYVGPDANAVYPVLSRLRLVE